MKQIWMICKHEHGFDRFKNNNYLFRHNNKYIHILTKQILLYIKSRKPKIWHTAAYILVIKFDC